MVAQNVRSRRLRQTPSEVSGYRLEKCSPLPSLNKKSHMHRWLAVKAAGLDAWLVLSIENDQGAGLRICKWRGVEVTALGRLK